MQTAINESTLKFELIDRLQKYLNIQNFDLMNGRRGSRGLYEILVEINFLLICVG